jgi:hypothetical protein
MSRLADRGFAVALLAGMAGLLLPVGGEAQERPLARFNIYASLPEYPTAPADTAARALVGRLAQCGIKAEFDNSTAYVGLTPQLLIVLSGPHRVADAADAELARARGCNIEGYARATRRRPGVMED